jgi:hypothetical protein
MISKLFGKLNKKQGGLVERLDQNEPPLPSLELLLIQFHLYKGYVKFMKERNIEKPGSIPDLDLEMMDNTLAAIHEELQMRYKVILYTSKKQLEEMWNIPLSEGGLAPDEDAIEKNEE